MGIVKIIGIGITALIIIIILKQYKPEFAVYIAIIARYINSFDVCFSNIRYCKSLKRHIK